MKKKILLLGSGGHAISCADVIESENKYLIIGLIDKLKYSKLKYPIIGDDKVLKKIKYKNILIAIGSIKNLLKREKIYQSLKKMNFDFPKIVSPHSYISKNSKIGEGTIIMHNVVINSNVSIGKNCIINTGAVIEHGVSIGNNCHVSTGVT